MSGRATAAGRRVLVVGGSSGVGRAAAVELWRRGAQVVALGRRQPLLAELAAECAGLATVTADVRELEQCVAAVEATVATMGGIDAVLYSTGASGMAPLVETGADEWRRIFDTNVIGAGLMFRAAHTHLSTSRGRMMFLSSISAYKPKPLLIPYAASKAALRKVVEGLRTEHPDIGFGIVSIGSTEPTDFSRDIGPEALARAQQIFRSGGFMNYTAMQAADVAEQIANVLLAPMVVEDLTLLGPNAV